MDFFTLATEQKRFFRMLDEVLGEDDDQRNGVSSGFDSMYSAPAAFVATTANVATATASRPFFSKQSEAELYLLATNFLLYVAMVIVVILVCHIYFPEALQSRVATTRPRKYNYRVAEEQQDHCDEDYGSEAEPAFRNSEDEEVLDSSEDELESPNFLEFRQESLSRKQVLRRLLFCSVMLNITFVLWGVLQVCECVMVGG